MATAESLAIRTEKALQSLADGASLLSAAFAIPPLVFPDRRRGEELTVERLEAIAAYVADLSQHLISDETEKTTVTNNNPINYHLMAESDLRRLAGERGLVQEQGPSKAELVQLLVDADADAASQKAALEKQQQRQEEQAQQVDAKAARRQADKAVGDSDGADEVEPRGVEPVSDNPTGKAADRSAAQSASRETSKTMGEVDKAVASRGKVTTPGVKSADEGKD